MLSVIHFIIVNRCTNKQDVTDLSNGYWTSRRKTEVGEDREKTALQKLEPIIKESRLRWFGHVLWIDDGRLSKQVMRFNANSTK